jgi:hypothetical protein
MQFWQLISHIKKDGCNVRLYDKEELKVAQCAGTFDITKKGNPLICLATKGHTQQELLQLLLHEYAHFLQWKTGLLHKLEGENLKKGWVVLDNWLRHRKKYTEEELLLARDAIILIEYDADIRAIEISKELSVDIGSHKTHMENAYSYITLIKWAVKNRRWGEHPGEGYFDSRVRTPTEILREITPEEEQVLNDCLGEE